MSRSLPWRTITVSRAPRSKRPSVSSAPPDEVFFVDRDLGPRFVEALRAIGLSVEAHTQHFGPETSDEEWLQAVATRGWIVLTHDAKIRYSSRAKQVILESGVRVFVVKGKRTIGEMAKAFVRTLPKIRNFLRRHHGPFIAKIYGNSQDPTKAGRVELWLSANGP